MTPYKPAHPCGHPGCPELISTGSRCERHRREENRAYNRRRRANPTTDDSFYSSPQWRALRASQLARQPLCEMCLEVGYVKAARVADHITPIRAGGDPFGELRSLCDECHSAHHARLGDRFGRKARP